MNNDEDMHPAKIRKYNLLINMCSDMIDRLDNCISHLNSQSLNFIALITVISSIILTILLFQFQNDSFPSCYVIVFIIIYFLINIGIVVINLLYIIYPSLYMELNIFQRNRWETISNLSEEDIYPIILFDLIKIYYHNREKYMEEMNKFKYSIIVFFISTFVIIALGIYYILL